MEEDDPRLAFYLMFGSAGRSDRLIGGRSGWDWEVRGEDIGERAKGSEVWRWAVAQDIVRWSGVLRCGGVGGSSVARRGEIWQFYCSWMGVVAG